MNNSAGEDLSWYWKEMFIENYKLDQAIAGLEYIKNDPAQGANITVMNMEKGAMPLIIQITTKSGKKEIVKFPVEVWEYTSKYVFKTNSSEPIESIVIDPDNVFPDVNPGNNRWNK